MLAVAGQGCPDARQAKTWLQRLWDAPMPVGRYRYYDGLLALLGLLQAGGRFQALGRNGLTKPRGGSLSRLAVRLGTPPRCVPARAATAGWTVGGVCRT